jgi:hypothetical protein
MGKTLKGSGWERGRPRPPKRAESPSVSIKSPPVWIKPSPPYVWEYRGAPKRFRFRVAYRDVRERDVGTPSPEETVSVGG